MSRQKAFVRGVAGWVCLLVLLTFAATSSVAQSTFATITGSITDPTGAGVPGATIEVVNLGTGYTYQGTTTSSGTYSVPNLLEGAYRLKASAPGFQEFVADNIILTARTIRRVDVTFQVGQVTTAVEVTAGATLIETETARLSDVRVRQTMIDMPLSLRRAWDIVQMSPNVSKTKSGFNMRFGGSRTKQGDVTVDGVSISNVFGGQITGVVSDRTESYQELRVEVAGGLAENPGIGQMSIVTRAGSNELHGEAFNYYTSPGLQARNPFSVVNTGSIEWVPGGSIGGPIFIPKFYDGRNKSFFFSSLEFERFGPPSLQTFNTSVPLEPWRRGNFSALLPGTIVRDPFASNAPFANNILPTGRLNRAALVLQDRYYPLPNFGDPAVFAAQNNRQVLDNPKLTNPTWVTRLDHRFNDRAMINGRFTMVRWPQKPFVGSLPTVGRVDRERRNNGISIAYTQTISNSLWNEFRYGFASDAFPSTPPGQGKALVTELGFQGLAPNLPDVNGLPTISFTNLALTGISSDVQCNPCIDYKRHTFQDNVSWFTNRHSFKFGAQIGRGSYTDFRQGAGLFGNNTFSNRFTGFTYADYLLGIPTTMARNFPALAQDTQSITMGFFAQDEFRVHPRLTLNLGLRYDLLPAFTATNGLQSMFDIGSGKIVVPDGALSRVSPLMPTGYVDVVEASKLGFHPSRLINTDKNNFSPRVGFAWRPFGNDTVIRGGAGIYYDITARNASLSGVPFNIAEPNYTNSTTNPLTWPTVFPSSIAGPGSVAIPGAINPDIRIPYSLQYNFTIERQQWDTGFRVSYIGTATRQGVWAYNINQPVADTRPFVSKPRLFPNYPNVIYTTNGAGHQYHALTLEADRPLAKGLRAQAYYTWARDIGDLEDGEQPEDAYNRQRERTVWTDIPTHRFSTNMLYMLPLGKGQSFVNTAPTWVNTMVSGWQIGAVYTIESGNFLTPQWTGPDPTGTRFTNNTTPANVTIRPDILRNPNLSNPTLDRWFDVSAFAAPTAGSFGTSSKGVIIGPGINVLHMNLAKITTIRERVRLRTEIVATNALNHPNYNDPGLNISQTAGAGVVTAVLNRNNKVDSAIPRYVQLVLRIQW
jgi:hypothetical protein